MPAPSKPVPGGFACLAGDIEMPTHLIPNDCMCTWSVTKPGPGVLCVSGLRYRNTLCPVRHRVLPAVPARFSRGQ